MKPVIFGLLAAAALDFITYGLVSSIAGPAGEVNPLVRAVASSFGLVGVAAFKAIAVTPMAALVSLTDSRIVTGFGLAAIAVTAFGAACNTLSLVAFHGLA